MMNQQEKDDRPLPINTGNGSIKVCITVFPVYTCFSELFKTEASSHRIIVRSGSFKLTPNRYPSG